MKPRKRDIEIFNMSVLDLLTGALGAFCFLTLALFPYYYLSHEVSAAETKAAKELAAQSRKIHSQIAEAAPGSNGMPPFAVGNLYSTNPRNEPCGAFQITNYSGPGGDASIKMLPANIRNGYSTFAVFFMLAPGNYQIMATAYANSLPCSLHIVELGKTSSPDSYVNLTRSLEQFTLSTEAKAEDLAFARVFKP